MICHFSVDTEKAEEPGQAETVKKAAGKGRKPKQLAPAESLPKRTLRSNTSTSDLPVVAEVKTLKSLHLSSCTKLLRCLSFLNQKLQSQRDDIMVSNLKCWIADRVKLEGLFL